MSHHRQPKRPTPRTYEAMDIKTEILNEVAGLTNVLEQEDKQAKDALRATLERLTIDPTEHLAPPQVAWEQVGNGETAILGTLGNFSLVIGKAKSRKSFFLNVATSAALGKDLILERFRGCLPTDQRNVLYFDTEQGKYHVQLALKRICKQIGQSVPEHLSVYGLRTLPPSERLQVIEYAVYNTPGLGFVVIDGIKDLVTSINDEAEATMIASKLLKWTEEINVHIVTVLHQNKSDNNARGHIGSELINKAETVLSVTKSEQDKDISVVQPEMCRNREPEPFAFEIVDGLPMLAENYEIRTSSKYDATELPDHEIFGLLNVAFSKAESYKYGELVAMLQLAFKDKFKRTIGKNKTKDMITYCKSNNWLIQEVDRGPYIQGKFNDNGLEGSSDY